MDMLICVSCPEVANSSDGIRCKPCYNKTVRKYRKDNPEIIKKIDKRHSLKRKYGMKLEEYQQRSASQNNSCEICGRIVGILSVDHNHITGQVRGLVCNGCNIKIGVIESKQLDSIYLCLEKYANLR